MKTPIRIEDSHFLVDADHELICKVESATDGELAHIVKAVNSYPVLLEAVGALEEASRIIDYAQSCIDSDYNRQHVLDRWVGIRATLRKLRGEQG